MKKNSFKKATQDAAYLPVINTGKHCTIDSKNYEIFSQFEWFQDDDGRIKTLVYVLSPQIMDLAEMVYAKEHGATFDDVEPATEEDMATLLYEMDRPDLND
jgi:hypothetical protein